MINLIARQWVDALRSGKFEQGEKKLKTEDNKYCCLGVLCEVMHWPTRASNGDFLSSLNCDQMQRVSMDEREMHILMRLNDNGVSFNLIADFIEKGLRQD